MAGLGILFIIFGFGSLILAEFGYNFRILSWADDMQPAFGIILGIVGVLILGAAIVMNRRKQAATPANGQWGQPAGGQFGGPQTGAQGVPSQGQAQFGGPQTGSQPPQGYQQGPPPGYQPGQQAGPAQQPPQFGEQDQGPRP